MKKITVKSSRHYSAHNTLLAAAENYLSAAKNNEKFCSDGHFVSLVMSALAVEALCNTAGDLIFYDWQDYESCNPRAKIKIICRQLEIPCRNDIDPFKTIFWLVTFRNKIAHAKPEPLKKENEFLESEFNRFIPGDAPLSKIEMQITIGNAEKALDAINSFEGLIQDFLPEEKKNLLYDLWEMRTDEQPNS